MMRTFIIAMTAAAGLFASSALTQERSQGTASIPDVSGVWGNPYLYGIEPPLSGLGPVVNKSRRRQTLDADGGPLTAANAPLVSDATKLVGDYTNPILRPETAEIVRKHAEMSLAGLGYPSPRNQCWPQGVPFIFTNAAVLLLQQPDKITMLYDEDHEVRRVRMNVPHTAQVTPSWYGDSVGHYEGDTLVIDTVGFKIGPFSAVDQYGTPYTQALHVVERYRLIDYEAAREAWQRGGRENFEHRMQDTVRIAAIRHRRRKSLAHTKLALRRAEQQQAAIRGLGAAVEIYCKFLAVDGWQVERERRIVGHGGCGLVLIARSKAIRHRFAM
jgi:hypothetical protein